jgi:peptidoglycan/xylan/chitin deacetylase (PgdA/CDA1 family)
MKKNLPLVLTLTIASCASNMPTPNKPMAYKANVKSDRVPSSEVYEVDDFKKEFENMMSKDKPEEAFVDYLNRLKNIYARTEAYLSDFDAELDESIKASGDYSYEKMKSYKKLLVMYELSHRLHDNIIFHYVSLSDIAYNRDSAPDQKKQAKNILKKFKSKLDSGSPIDKISFENIKHDLATILFERRKVYSSKEKIPEISTKSFSNEDEKLQVLRQYRDSIRALGRKEAEKDQNMTMKIEDSADALQIIDNHGREPQSELKFYPSTGGNGNVMGLIFPKNVWALTYDDGPSPIHTPVVLKNLETLGIKATFFWLAQNVITNQATVDLAKSKGMVLANHSWSHAQLPKVSEEQLQKEIVKSTEVESKAYGMPVRFFRCPYGAGNSVQHIRQMIADLGMIHVFWNVDTLDWQDKDPDSIVARAQKQMAAAGHGVILFHDIHSQSVIASRKLVEWSQTLKGSPNDIRWVTIPEIVDEMNGTTASSTKTANVVPTK